MMMKFFLFSSLAHLYIIVSSSVMPQYGDIVQKQYNDYKLMSAFRKYLTVPTKQSYSSFRSHTLRYYKRSPIDCLNLSGRHRNDWVFLVVFWRALEGPIKFINLTKITPVYYSKILEWISLKIGNIFLNCGCSDESEFKSQLEMISLLIKLAERTAFELKSLGINDDLINGLSDRAITWNYLIRNFSIDFDKKTIDYHSLSRTINEICLIIKMDSSSNGPSMRLSKRYTLLVFYLRFIYMNDCNVIFDSHHHHRALISYLIMKMSNAYDDYGFYPDHLKHLFEEFYNSGSIQLNPIANFLRNYNPELSFYQIPKRIPSLSMLALSLTKDFEQENPGDAWNIRALAELEAYIVRHDGILIM